MYSSEIYHAIRDFMTEELWGFSNLSSQKLGTWKAQICYQQISIIRPYWLSDQSELGSLLSKNHEAFQ